jgi:hypothetical protein
MSEVDEFLAASNYESHPGFKFTEVGQTCKGTIVSEPRVVETDDLNGGRSKKLVLDVETAEGTFSLWLPANRKITTAVSQAVKEAGATGLAQGGKIAVKFTGEGEQLKVGFNPPKLFTAKYEAPAKVVAVDDMDAPF